MKTTKLILLLVLSFALFNGCSENETTIESINSTSKKESINNTRKNNIDINYKVMYIEYYLDGNIPRGESYAGLIREISEHITIYSDTESETCGNLHLLHVNIQEFEEYFQVSPRTGDGTGHSVKKPQDEESEGLPNRPGIYTVDLEEYEGCF